MHGMKDDVTKIKESQMMMTIRQELEEKCVGDIIYNLCCDGDVQYRYRKGKIHVGQGQVVNHAIRARYCENASKHHFPPGADYMYLTC